MNARRTSFWKRRLKERVSNSDKEVSCCIQLEKFYLRKRIWKKEKENSRNSTWGSEFVRADLDWRFRVASLVLPRLIHLQTTANGCQSRERQKTERLRLRQSPQNRLGVLVSVWTYQYIVIMKIHYMSLPKKDQELGICQLLVSSTEATFVAFVGLIKYA